jgi:hypothetical protein
LHLLHIIRLVAGVIEFFTFYYGLQPAKKRKISEITVKKPRFINTQKNWQTRRKNGSK